MSKKPKPEAKMLPLNVDLPAELIDSIQFAKFSTRKPIRDIIREAVEDWMKKNGINPPAVSKLKAKS